ncbi:YveK family protein [Paenibacillus humicola]|uniref:YveK family protein n=1 Tax=Paenibacillus humicola TaxID=3110540 RepID=UPI00237BE308|nr:Wzz/FepE/Etk N-terminal domain-containing protein [Paenibacillus humicola]
MELVRYWNIIRKKLWMIALIVIVCCTAVGYYTSHFIKPEYVASADLIVGPKTGSKASPDAGSINSNILLIKTYKEVIRTPRIMSKVAEQYPQLQATAGELIAEVSVSSANDTQVMTISARDRSYERASRIANAVSQVFQQEVPALFKVDNVTVLNLADPSGRHFPVSPNPTMNVAVTFILTLLAGIVIAFVLDQLDDTVKTEHDVQSRLGLPLLAGIPKIKSTDVNNQGDPMHMTNPAGRKNNVTLDA